MKRLVSGIFALLILASATPAAHAADEKAPAVPGAPPATSENPPAVSAAPAAEKPAAAATVTADEKKPASGTSATETKQSADTKKPAEAKKPAGSKKAPASAKAEVDSLTLLEKAVARDSSKFDNLYQLGIMYLDRDRPSDALKVLTRASRIRPKDVRVLVNLGATADAGGNPDLAQGYYREALKVAPSDSVASCRLSSSLYSQAKYQEAIDILRDLIRDKPGSYCAYFTLGVAFADAGIYRDAIRMWKKVIQIAPASPEATSAKESIEVLEKFVSP